MNSNLTSTGDGSLDDFESFIKRSDSFDITLFHSLLNCLMDVKDTSESEVAVLKYYNKMLIEADAIT